MLSTKDIFKFVRILSAAGIVLALYLLWEQLSHSPFQPCSINSIINCNAVISGPLRDTFGIPTPLYGLAGYIAISLCTLLRSKKTLLAIVSFGLAFCLGIAYQELFLLRVVCPICITCQLIMITIFALALDLQRRS